MEYTVEKYWVFCFAFECVCECVRVRACVFGFLSLTDKPCGVVLGHCFPPCESYIVLLCVYTFLCVFANFY